MGKNVANFIGFTTESTNLGISGFWNLFDATRYRRESKWPGSSGVGYTATGVLTYTPGNGYVYQVFQNPGTFTVNSLSAATSAELLIVGGGGQTAPSYSAGGGAGGIMYVRDYPLAVATYTITVGAGGAPPSATPTATGSPTTFVGPPGTLTAVGGGGAGTYPVTAGKAGGSGGGEQDISTGVGPGTQPSQPKPSSATNYGNPGGSGLATGAFQAAGGGGAGGAGGPAPGPAGGAPGGAGGVGVAFTGFEYPLVGLSTYSSGQPNPANSPTNNHYGGGGSGWGYGPAPNPRSAGGGGAGGSPLNSPEDTCEGLRCLGGGAGSQYSLGHNGGSGIVIIRYPDA